MSYETEEITRRLDGIESKIEEYTSWRASNIARYSGQVGRFIIGVLLAAIAAKLYELT